MIAKALAALMGRRHVVTASVPWAGPGGPGPLSRAQVHLVEDATQYFAMGAVDALRRLGLRPGSPTGAWTGHELRMSTRITLRGLDPGTVKAMVAAEIGHPGLRVEVRKA